MPSLKDNNIVLYSNNITLLDTWSSYLKDYQVIILDDEDKLLDTKNSLVIFNIESISSSNKYIDSLIKQNNKIFLLQNISDFIQAQRFLKQGICGYGNSMMSEVFFNYAIMSILDGFIWLPPQFTQKLIDNIPQNNNSSYYLKLLTTKEKEIALLVCEGLSNIEICEKLDISVNTVKTHLKKIYEKLNVKDRLALVILLK